MIYGRKQCDPMSGCGKIYHRRFTVCPYCKASDAFSNLVPFDPRDCIYDLECYPNIFTASFKNMQTGNRAFFEVSDRMNQIGELIQFLRYLAGNDARLIGFNNVGYDYPMIHNILLRNTMLSAADIYEFSAAIIATPWDRRFDNVVWDDDVLIPQIDLYKIHHFDNDARRTSLKMLEFNMRSENIEDLPFEPGYPLTLEQIPTLIKYNNHDVDETGKFYEESIEMIEFREGLSEKYGKNMMNHSDKKIGTEVFIQELENQSPGACYYRDENNRRKPRQTLRPVIHLRDVMLPYIQFRNSEFERVKRWLASQSITETKGVFNDLSATIKGFTYVFGLGGIHGSIDSAVVCSDDEYVIYDWDVAGYYPSVGSANNLYPAHLSQQFGVVDNTLKVERSKHAKGTPLNKSIKLARNGAYGDSNNKYSPFYDPQYTMAITINGQLSLCMLAEQLTDVPGIEMIQINTDGLTIRLPRYLVGAMNAICEWWQGYTGLELEHVIYSRMMIRDVNNYIAETEDGKLKRKGAYGYETPMDNPSTQEREWHKNHTALIVPKAAEAALVHGVDISDFIHASVDIFDFMLRTKVGRSDSLILTDQVGNKRELQKITRYYIGKQGGALTKISPPVKGMKVGQWKRANGLTNQFYNAVITELKHNGDIYEAAGLHDLDSTGLPWDERINTNNKSKYEIRRTDFNVGWLVSPCNNINDADWSNIDYEYYIAEARKLVEPLL